MQGFRKKNIKKYNSYSLFNSNSRIQEVQRDIDETKGVMADNIDMMIKNQEKAEILQDKTGNYFITIFYDVFY